MSVESDKQHAAIIDAIRAVARQRLTGPAADEASRFVELVYARISPDDLAAAPPADRYGAALTLLAQVRDRQPGRAKLRIFNPNPADHGWSSPHTVVAIVNDDMPFLVDSVTAEIVRRDLAVHLLVHPILKVARDPAGRLTEFGPGAGEARESMMLIEIDRLPSGPAQAELLADLERVLGEVRQAVGDWGAMRQAAVDVAEGLEGGRGRLAEPDLIEARAFLEWIANNHFTFLGYRRYRYAADGTAYELVPESGLGMLRDPEVRVFDTLGPGSAVPAAIRAFVAGSQAVLLTKTDRVTSVHRRAAMDCIIVKTFAPNGRVEGEHRLVGLFTSTAYNASPRAIPLLRRKVAVVLERAGLDPASHDGKAIVNILETFPRDELFQLEADTLLDWALGILRLQERQRTALFVRPDPLGRYVTCLVYAPRERYDSLLRQRFSTVLENAFGGKVTSFSTVIADDSMLARVLFTVRLEDGLPSYHVQEIEARLAAASRTWRDRLKEALIQRSGEEKGLELARRYAHAFPTAYQELAEPAGAMADLDRVERALATGRLQINLYRRPEQSANTLSLKLFRPGAPIPLSDVLPLLENMGVRVITEVPHSLRPLPAQPDATPADVFLHDFTLETADGAPVELDRVKETFQDAFDRVWTGGMESDGFNRLVLAAGLGWREVVLLRSYCKYLRQAGIPFSQDYMERALVGNPGIAGLLVRRFVARFDPDAQAQAEQRCGQIDAEIDSALEAVASLDEDRILRRFLNAIRSTLRTNFFQAGAGGEPRPWLSIKLDSRALDDLPLPRPMVEVFVYSPRAEGIHLRGGKVARGGIRWSDRREDFRTEILGLMKAQMVKNAVIVPVGSKGGFVVKRPPAVDAASPAGREAVMAEAIECYKTLIRGLLDVTDNLGSDEVRPPDRVVRLDGDDPYLVVAADKGTATFSDIANGVAREYGFWLDDAFASGGSAGYDHKEMGITARGAWECVKRHFRELGHDVQKADFTVAGVGDMSGDVFGNGMLRSRHIRLLAAFDHRHIFLDPAPDAARSFAERERLFALPRSSWDDYDKSLISKGGGIFPRSLKSVPLSAEVKAMLEVEADHLTPAELIKAILRSRVDLLWFGGIGTYVKASSETAADAGDRANDPLRIDGREVRARVVGEGANLAVTQRGRVEIAQAGARINTDALDNSAGVDCSDHEVNIKIALGQVVQSGDMTMKQRDELLAAMTDDVAALVLRDNYQQSQAISVAEAQAAAMIGGHARMMRNLELAGKLDRAVEFLPGRDALAQRQAAGRGLTRPELSVLLAYSKIVLNEELLDSDLPDDPLLEVELVRYFPTALSQRFPEAMRRHRLRREIVVTQVVNSMINRVGSTFIEDMRERCGARSIDITRAYALARDIYRLRALWAEIETLDDKLAAAAQLDMLIATQRLIEAVTLWVLRTMPPPFDTQETVARFAPGIATLVDELPGLLPENDRAALEARARALIDKGAPEGLAQRVALLEPLALGCEVIRLAEKYQATVGEAASVYFAAGDRFGLNWLRGAAGRLPRETPWQALAVNALADDVLAQQSSLAESLLADGRRDGDLAAWIEPRRGAVERFDRLVADLRGQTTVDLAMLTVAARDLRVLTG